MNVVASAVDLALRIENLRKIFGPGGRGAHRQVVAVDDVSLELPVGGSLAIVGESGSGKTTTARIVAGLETATSGRVVIFGATERGRRATKTSRIARAKRVQMVFQDTYGSLDPAQTVGGGLLEIVRLHDQGARSERRARARELFEQVGLAERLFDRRPGELSGGQRQRVAIARALAIHPQLLILDEPVASLDVSVQAQIVNLLAEIRQQYELSILLISHDLSIVRQLSESVTVMRKGRIVEAGPTDDVLDRPTEPYTKLLRDSVPRPGWHLTETSTEDFE